MTIHIRPMGALGVAATYLALAGSVWVQNASAATFNTIYAFGRGLDGYRPNGGLLMDASGNLYGTTQFGGKYARHNKPAGVAYELVPNADKSAWTFVTLHSFHGFQYTGRKEDGGQPNGDLIQDVAGNLYGTTFYGGQVAKGSVFELLPNESRTKWTLKILYSFCQQAGCADGWGPFTGLTYVGQATGAPYDGTSPLYGFTSGVSGTSTGNVFQLVQKKGQIQETVIYSFCSKSNCADGRSSNGGQAPLTADVSGNLYGITEFGGTGAESGGTVFELSPGRKGKWTETVLYNFCSQANCTDGLSPGSSVIFDGAGNIYGTTSLGGIDLSFGYGVVYRLSRNGPSVQYNVLYDFCSLPGCADGGDPGNGLVLDASGNLFGTTGWFDSGDFGDKPGTVFELSGGTFNLLYTFCSQPDCSDGYEPTGVIRDMSGKLFGTTFIDGGPQGAGTVYQLVP